MTNQNEMNTLLLEYKTVENEEKHDFDQSDVEIVLCDMLNIFCGKECLLCKEKERKSKEKCIIKKFIEQSSSKILYMIREDSK